MAARAVGLTRWGGPALLGLGGCGALASTFLRWHTGLEGVYFNRSVGAPAYAGVFGAFGGNAWSAFNGLAVVLAVFAGYAALVALAISRVRTERIGLIAVMASAMGFALGGWIVQIAFSRPGLVGLGPGPMI